MNRESTHKVLLIIADISGYTKLMVSSDIEIIHSQHIISELIQALIKEVEIPLEISKLEGDALFLYARKDSGIIPPDDIRICQLAAAIGLFFEFQKSGKSLSLKSDY
jgi:hypothetical protein